MTKTKSLPLTSRTPGEQRFHLPRGTYQEARQALEAKRLALANMERAKSRLVMVGRTLEATQAAVAAAEDDLIATSQVHEAHQRLTKKLGRPEDVKRAEQSRAARSKALHRYTAAAASHASTKRSMEQAKAGLAQARENYDAVMRPKGSEL